MLQKFVQTTISRNHLSLRLQHQHFFVGHRSPVWRVLGLGLTFLLIKLNPACGQKFELADPTSELYYRLALVAGANIQLEKDTDIIGNLHSNGVIQMKKDTRVTGDLAAVEEIENRGTVTGAIALGIEAISLPKIGDIAALRSLADQIFEEDVTLRDATLYGVMFVNGEVRIDGLLQGVGTIIATKDILLEGKHQEDVDDENTSISLISLEEIRIGKNRPFRGVLRGRDVTLEKNVSFEGVIVADGMIHVEKQSRIHFFDFDQVPPEIALSSPADGSFIGTATPLVEVSLSDDLSGLRTDSLELLLDGTVRSDQAVVSENAVTLTVAEPLEDGLHTLEVSMTDYSDNVGRRLFTWTTDTLAPEVTITSPTASTIFNDVPPIAVEYFDATSGVSLPSFAIDLNGADILARCTVAATAICEAPPDLAEDAYTLVVVVRDRAGNPASASLEFEFILDKEPPHINLVSPMDGTVVEMQQLQLIGEVVDKTGVAEVLVHGRDALLSENRFSADVELVPGPNSILIEAADVLGNRGAQTFSVIFKPVPARLRVKSGDQQFGKAGEAVPEPLVVIVEDEVGNPVPGEPVRFIVTQNNGALRAGPTEDSASELEILTDDAGSGAAFFTLGDAAGDNVVIVDVEGVDPIVFNARSLLEGFSIEGTLHRSPGDPLIATVPADDGELLQFFVQKDETGIPQRLTAFRKFASENPGIGDDVFFDAVGRPIRLKLRTGYTVVFGYPVDSQIRLAVESRDGSQESIIIDLESGSSSLLEKANKIAGELRIGSMEGKSGGITSVDVEAQVLVRSEVGLVPPEHPESVTVAGAWRFFGPGFNSFEDQLVLAADRIFLVPHDRDQFYRTRLGPFLVDPPSPTIGCPEFNAVVKVACLIKDLPLKAFDAFKICLPLAEIGPAYYAACITGLTLISIPCTIDDVCTILTHLVEVKSDRIESVEVRVGAQELDLICPNPERKFIERPFPSLSQFDYKIICSPPPEDPFGDRDGDEVINVGDQCPDTREGIAVDPSDGCPIVGSVEVTPEELALETSETFDLNLTLRPFAGDKGILLLGLSASWQSTNPAIVSVDQGGSVTANEIGQALIFATVGGISDFAEVSVLSETGRDDVDADGDGIPDRSDLCPTEGGAVGPNGCPEDSDGDGVRDDEDECPAEGGTVDETGCPIDKDENGVSDDGDLCPDTPPDTAVDEDGCPLGILLDVLISPEGAQLAVGESIGFSATLVDLVSGEVVNAENVAFEWSTSDPSIVIIDTESGSASGIAVGHAMVTANAFDIESGTPLNLSGATEVMVIDFQGVWRGEAVCNGELWDFSMSVLGTSVGVCRQSRTIDFILCRSGSGSVSGNVLQARIHNDGFTDTGDVTATLTGDTVTGNWSGTGGPCSFQAAREGN